MLERPDVTIRDLVEAVQKIEATNKQCHLQRMDASRYPLSTSSSYNKLTYSKDKDKDHKDGKDKPHDRFG